MTAKHRAIAQQQDIAVLRNRVVQHRKQRSAFFTLHDRRLAFGDDEPLRAHREGRVDAQHALFREVVHPVADRRRRDLDVAAAAARSGSWLRASTLSPCR
jgi:hypothetical protein